MKRLAMTAVLELGLAISASAFDMTFENPNEVDVSVPHTEELNFTDGFTATIRFSCDFARVGGGKFGNLFTKGKDFDGGYSVMVRNDGRLLVDLKGVKPAYRLSSVGLESGKEYVLQIYETGKAVRIFVNGEEKGSYGIVGKRDMSGNAEPLRIGGKGWYGFAGELKRVKIVPFDPSSVPPPQFLPPAKQARAEIKWAKPICVENDRYIGWPTVCRLKNGDLLAVFSGDRDSHICPWGKVQMVRSSDGGETWSAPVTIANGPLDDRDAGIVQMPDGEIVVTYFTSVAYRDPKILAKHPEYKRHDEKISKETETAARGYFRIVSRDDGRTWSKPERMNVSHAPHGPTLLRDGSLFQIGREFRHEDVQGSNGVDYTVIRAEKSFDHGKTWQVLCEDIPDTDGENGVPHMFHEPNAVELADGTLVGMVRYHGAKGANATDGNGYLRETVSKDGGKTWTPMAATPMLGLPPHLFTLPDGKLVCVYGRRNAVPGFGEFACVSDDGGKTWDAANEIVLARSHCGDLGYPASCVLPDGWIVSVYYQQPEPGVKPCLMATKWRVVR